MTFEASRLMEIERECERLVKRYCHIVDLAGGDGLAELFAEGGVLEINGVMVGRDALRARPAAPGSMQMRHFCTNILIDVVDESSARGVTYLVAYVEPAGTEEAGLPAFVGEYHDEFVLTPDGWRFASRRTHATFRRS